MIHNKISLESTLIYKLRTLINIIALILELYKQLLNMRARLLYLSVTDPRYSNTRGEFIKYNSSVVECYRLLDKIETRAVDEVNYVQYYKYLDMVNESIHVTRQMLL